MWDNSTVTDAGSALLARWAGGGTLTIDNASVGSGVVAAVQLGKMTELTDERHVLGVAGVKTVDGGVCYTVKIPAADAAYTINQIGIWGHLDDDERTLIAVYQDDTGISIPAVSEMPDFLYSFFATIQTDVTGELSVTLDSSTALSRDEAEELIDEKIKDVKPEDIGAADAEHTHTGYAASSHNHSASNITSGTLPVARGGTGNTSVDTTPTSGSTKMVTSGGVHTALAGKADSSHKHSASDITSGALSVERGGTGNTSVDTTPTSGSTKMVTSGGVYTALSKKANSSHNQAASTVTAGTLGGKVVANASAVATLTDKQVRNVYAGTSDMTDGSSSLTTGDMYVKY